MKWFAIHTQTGQEDKVKANILNRVEIEDLKDKIGEILVPTERVSEIKSGKKRVSLRKFFPGYVLIHMELSDNTWYFIKNTPGVTGFIGSGKKPLPLKEKEIESILKQAEEKKEKETSGDAEETSEEAPADAAVPAETEATDEGDNKE